MEKYIFDFDGTLVDSMNQYSQSVVSVLVKNKIEFPDDIFKIITPLGYKGAAEYFINNFGLEMTVDEITEETSRCALHEYTYNIPAKDTVKETLKELKRKGHSLNVLTASPHSALDVCLKRLGMTELFDNIWSCEDFSTTKSDVNIYHAVARKLNTSVDNCIFLDDNINAVTTAKKAGMKTIGVYDDSSKEYENEFRELCDGYIYKFSELIQ